MLSIWSAWVDGSLKAVLRLYFPHLKYRDDTLGAHFSQKARDVLSIPYQLQKLYIGKISETISDVQTLNGEKYFRSYLQLKDMTDLPRYIAADWRYGSIQELESLPFPHYL